MCVDSAPNSPQINWVAPSKDAYFIDIDEDCDDNALAIAIGFEELAEAERKAHKRRAKIICLMVLQRIGRYTAA